MATLHGPSNQRLGDNREINPGFPRPFSQISKWGHPIVGVVSLVPKIVALLTGFVFGPAPTPTALGLVIFFTDFDDSPAFTALMLPRSPRVGFGVNPWHVSIHVASN
jgi:hypothetical protein